jgi:hypothetical protein
MSRTAVPARLDDNSYWRRLLATCHPDRNNGDHELFLFLTALREHVESCDVPSPQSYTTGSSAERIPFDEQLGYVDEHVTLTMRAISIGQREVEPYRSTLGLLLDCSSQVHGRPALRQCRGATFKQLAYAAYLVGMSKTERVRWYELARSIPLSEKHISHIIGRRDERRAA